MNNNDFFPAHAFVSKAILSILALEEIDDESVYTFLINQQLAILRSLARSINDAKILSHELLNLLEKSLSEDRLLSTIDIYVSMFSENKQLLKEICDKVWFNSNDFSEKLRWLDDWNIICEDLMGKTHNRLEVAENLLIIFK